ncbi:MFS transporter [Microbispora sp. RL4-1S]|uniref:MFS transporter n=1 Tax=Microbispora oryzae TaxID=2806554 RepID=A0A940WIF4_9ACTN|nr:MFS transporter [Microbispora oryzae]MBP2705503.1 MFS transporter [Microbispora oryzae]
MTDRQEAIVGEEPLPPPPEAAQEARQETRQPEPEDAGVARHPGIAFTLAVVGYFMIALDMTIVSVAMSAISKGLDFSGSALSWITTSFTLTYAGFMMFGGRVVDLFGRRRSFVLGIGLFTAASLVSAIAPNGGVLIAARAVQGLGAAITTPCTLALILDLYPDGPRRRRAMGAFQAVIGSGAGFGLMLGGVLTDAFGWRWLFLVNVPVGGLILALTPLFIPTQVRAAVRARRFDALGAVTITAALVLLIYTLSETAQRGWLSTATLGGVAGALLLLVAFVLNERRSPDPLLPLHIPRNPVVYTANLRAGLVSGAFLCALVFLALDDEQVIGHTPTQAGLTILPTAVMILALGRIGPRIVGRFGIRLVARTAPLIMAAGFLWLAVTPSLSFLTSRLGPELLIGFGATLANLSNTLAATGAARPAERGVVSALQYTAQQTGSSAEVAAFVALAAAHTAQLMTGPSPIGYTSALHQGFQFAFLAAAIAGCLAALLAVRRANFPA